MSAAPENAPSGNHDYRSVCIIAEPVIGPEITWRSMAFVGGKCVNNVTGITRAAVLDDSMCAAEAALEDSFRAR